MQRKARSLAESNEVTPLSLSMAIFVMFMAKIKRVANREILSDYRLLGKMSSSLSEHQKNVRRITRNVARRFRSNLRLGLIERLSEISEHMSQAQRELGKARKELGKI